MQKPGGVEFVCQSPHCEHIEREKLNALFPEPLGISIPGALICWLKTKALDGHPRNGQDPLRPMGKLTLVTKCQALAIIVVVFALVPLLNHCRGSETCVAVAGNLEPPAACLRLHEPMADAAFCNMPLFLRVPRLAEEAGSSNDSIMAMEEGQAYARAGKPEKFLYQATAAAA